MLAQHSDINFENEASIHTELCNISHCTAHYHDNAIELIFCLKGSVLLRSSHRHVTLNSGDVFSMDPGDIHCIYSDNDNLILIVHLNRYSANYSQERISNCFLACETQHMWYSQKEPMYKIKDLLLASYFHEIEGTPEGQRKLSDQLFDLLIKHFDWLSFIWDPMDTNGPFHERFHRIIHYCQENHKEKITIGQLAKMEHINENYFSAFMRKTSFDSFGAMLNFIRCDAAERLLLTTDSNVIEISSTCGFSDPKYFYKHFNAWWDMSPAKLRKWYKEYAEATEEIYRYQPEEGYQILKDYLPQYHLERLLK